MDTKICLRSGGCCSGYFALVPKTETSDLSPTNLESMEDAISYIEEHSEGMGKPCKWLIRDEVTTEATCKVHTLKSSMCIDYPEYMVGNKYCGMGLAYWSDRKERGLPIPSSVTEILISEGR
jgi:Fe-S-cluster containining protein